MRDYLAMVNLPGHPEPILAGTVFEADPKDADVKRLLAAEFIVPVTRKRHPVVPS